MRNAGPVPEDDAENAGCGGCGLAGNLDVAVARAQWYLHLGMHQVSDCSIGCALGLPVIGIVLHQLYTTKHYKVFLGIGNLLSI